jgi:hypothetical protein
MVQVQRRRTRSNFILMALVDYLSMVLVRGHDDSICLEVDVRIYRFEVRI